tara:strand:+ start:404 stop:508 length:105 start_codon:yes stop_codon:yes gene_type:complete
LKEKLNPLKRGKKEKTQLSNGLKRFFVLKAGNNV